MKRQAPHHISQLVASNLRAGRKRKGLTQHELAMLVGSQGPQVSRWEKGTHRPKDEMLARLGEALDMTIAEFYTAPDEDQEPVAA